MRAVPTGEARAPLTEMAGAQHHWAAGPPHHRAFRLSWKASRRNHSVRIGVMLRHYDQHHGGVRVYTRMLLQALFELRTGHEFVLLYRDPALIGTHAGEPGVEEVALPARSFLTWDQLAVPAAVRRHRIDVLFNPKYSIPLRARCPSVWVCHGLDWY